MSDVYKLYMTDDDFFQEIADSMDDEELLAMDGSYVDWEEYVSMVADYAAEDDQDSINLCSHFESFLIKHGYADEINGILLEAAKAFTNDYSIKYGAKYRI